MAAERKGIWEAKANPAGRGFGLLNLDDPELTAKARQALADVRAKRQPGLAKAPSPDSKAALKARIEGLIADIQRLEADIARLRAASPLDLSGPPLVRVVVPVLIVSEANQRGSWHTVRGSGGRATKQKDAVTAALLAAGVDKQLLRQHPRLSVHFIRRAGRDIDDDNCKGGLKACQDAVARWFGCDDGPRGPVTWTHSQESGKRWKNVPELVIEVRPLP